MSNKTELFHVVEETKATFRDYVGKDFEKDELRLLMKMMYAPEQYPQGQHLRGVLITGPTGCGKNHLAECMAGELRTEDKNGNVAFVEVSTTELGSQHEVGRLFEELKEFQKVILFVDRIELLCKEVSGNPYIVPRFLKELDKMEERVLLLATANEESLLDAELVDSQWLEKKIVLDYPDKDTVFELVKHFTKDYDWQEAEKIYKDSSWYSNLFGNESPRKIRKLLREALLLYYRCNEFIARAVEKTGDGWAGYISVGEETIHRTGGNLEALSGVKEHDLNDGTVYRSPEKDSGIHAGLYWADLEECVCRRDFGYRIRVAGPSELGGFSVEDSKGMSSVAIHEVGHALIARFRKIAIDKVSLHSRDGYGGVVYDSGLDDLETKSDYLNVIDYTLGGRAAEVVFYGEDGGKGKGARSDLQKVTEYAREMVMKYGMSDAIGTMVLLKENGKQICSDHMMALAEEEVCRLLKERFAIVYEELRQNKDIVAELAEYVFFKGEVTGDEFREKCDALLDRDVLA